MDFIEYLNIMMKTGLKSSSLSTDFLKHAIKFWIRTMLW